MSLLESNDVCQFETQTRKSSRELLDLLREHHDYSIPAPPPRTKVELVTDQWVERQKANLLEKLTQDLGEKEPTEVHFEPRRISVLDIQRACAAHYGVTVNDIVSGRRTKNVVMPRQVAMYLSRRLTTNTFPQISLRFGKRDHTTALHGAAKIHRLLAVDAQLAATVSTLIEGLGGDVE